MVLTTTSNIFLSTSYQPDQARYGEISRLLSAALVDRQFCNLLLTRPDIALTNGYSGESFHLSSKERQFFLSAKSVSLTDLAERWVKFNNLCSR
jgi:hypothetical protein